MRVPHSRRMCSTNAQVEPLPFVPATWMTLSAVDVGSHAQAIEVHAKALELLLPGEVVGALGRRAGLAGDGALERPESILVLLLREGGGTEGKGTGSGEVRGDA